MIQKRVCDRCGKDFFETYKEWLCRACMNELGWECTPKTNADHIRSMSDEELAEWLDEDLGCCCYCSEDARLENEPLLRGEKCDEQCEKHLLDWLKQPYEGAAE